MSENKKHIPCPNKCGSPKCKESLKPKVIDYTKKPIIWVFGSPGSGKETQCEMITSKYGFVYLSIGDLLREEVTSRPSAHRSVMLTDIMDHGVLVPNDIVLLLLKNKIKANIESAKGFLIDGYLREWRQGADFEKAIAPPTMILFFDLSYDEMHELADSSAPLDLEDKEDTVADQQTNKDQQEMMIERYPNIVRRVNADQSPEEVFVEVQAILSSIGVEPESSTSLDTVMKE